MGNRSDTHQGQDALRISVGQMLESMTDDQLELLNQFITTIEIQEQYVVE